MRRPPHRSEIRRLSSGSGLLAVENPIRRPEKPPSGGLSVITVGRYSAMRLTRFVAPRGLLAPLGCFSIFASAVCS